MLDEITKTMLDELIKGKKFDEIERIVENQTRKRKSFVDYIVMKTTDWNNKDESLLPLLLKMRQHEDLLFWPREETFPEFIELLTNEKAIPYIKKALKTETNPYTRFYLIEALGKAGDGSYIKYFKELLQIAINNNDNRLIDLIERTTAEIKKERSR